MRSRISSENFLPKIRLRRSIRRFRSPSGGSPSLKSSRKLPGCTASSGTLPGAVPAAQVRTKTPKCAIPAGRRLCREIYQVRLTVDGKTQNQSLKVIMDPRSPATPEVLAQQLQLGRQIFGETIEARRALAEIGSVQKQLADIQQKLASQSAQLKSALAEAGSAIGKILTNKEHAADGKPWAAGCLLRAGIRSASCRKWGSCRAFAGDRGLPGVKPAGKSAHRRVGPIQANEIGATQSATA